MTRRLRKYCNKSLLNAREMRNMYTFFIEASQGNMLGVKSKCRSHSIKMGLRELMFEDKGWKEVTKSRI
jgi:hypothetical protein